MTQERLIYYENIRDSESGYNQEGLPSSVNILYKIRSSRDQLVHEDDHALPLIKCLIWTCFVSLIVLML